MPGEHRTERLCAGCEKPHHGVLWLYRDSTSTDAREWICAMKYLLLDPADRLTWQIIPILR